MIFLFSSEKLLHVTDHYENLLMQCTDFVKYENFQWKLFDFFAQDINCGYTLEPPLCLKAEIRSRGSIVL